MSLAPKMRLLSVALTLSVMLGAGFRASADEVRVETQTPFYSRTEFPAERGYFRTEDGHYYHYDKDRDGWHHGRNHREGGRLDKRREHDHDRDHDGDHR